MEKMVGDLEELLQSKLKKQLKKSVIAKSEQGTRGRIRILVMLFSVLRSNHVYNIPGTTYC